MFLILLTDYQQAEIYNIIEIKMLYILDTFFFTFAY
jgi:hypothetical protein